MSLISSQFRVFTAENQVFSTDKVWYEEQAVGSSKIIFVCFMPRNGMERKKKHMVPIQRVTRIVDMEIEEQAA